MRLTLAVILVACAAAPALAEPKSDAKLDELRVPSASRQQNDLDTRQLASAHRERAESMEQKTTGLWQSWLVSICEGCNPNQRRPDEIDAAADAYQPTNKMSVTGRSTTPPTIAHGQARPVVRRERSASLVSDLSSQNVRQIRMMPGQ